MAPLEQLRFQGAPLTSALLSEAAAATNGFGSEGGDQLANDIHWEKHGKQSWKNGSIDSLSFMFFLFLRYIYIHIHIIIIYKDVGLCI